MNSPQTRTHLLPLTMGLAVAACIIAVTAFAAVRVTQQTQTPNQAEVATAEQAMNALQQALITKLREAMDQGGPAVAVEVCRNEARAIGDRIAREHGIELGRTSHRVRNPANAPRGWAKAIVDRGMGAKIRKNLGDALSRAYPQDKATGFGPGDLRGWMWAEVA
jgi:hypothetical protein